MDLLDCVACPRLAAFLAACRAAHPDWHARPVPPAGPVDAPLLVVGLAPGFRGANRSGRPFVGDASGRWLHAALEAQGFCRSGAGEPELVGVRITNALKCCPPANRPTAEELRRCHPWLEAELGPTVRVVVALGAIAWGALSRAPFAHGAEVHGERVLLASYHPSPLVTRTGRMDEAAFRAIFARARALLDAAPPLSGLPPRHG